MIAFASALSTKDAKSKRLQQYCRFGTTDSGRRVLLLVSVFKNRMKKHSERSAREADRIHRRYLSDILPIFEFVREGFGQPTNPLIDRPGRYFRELIKRIDNKFKTS